MTKNGYKVAFIRKGKSCGCLIASNVISLEIQRRKNETRLGRLSRSLTKSKNSKAALNIKGKRLELLDSIKSVNESKKIMKKKFEDYVRKSGYAPPNSKNKR